MIFAGHLNLQNLNVRREKAGDGPGALAADLKFAGEVGLDALRPTIVSQPAFNLMDAFYTPEGELITSELETLNFEPERLAKLSLARALGAATGQEFSQAAFSGLQVELKPGRIAKIQFRVQVHPSSMQVGWLCEALSYSLQITLDEAQQSLPLEGEGPEMTATEVLERIDSRGTAAPLKPGSNGAQPSPF